MRVVSVLPSATEIVFALGHGSELVGRSAECDYPAAARTVPVVMRPRTLDSERPSGEIDRRVVAARRAGKSLYELDVGRLRELRPDLLLTQDLCGVCSVTDREVEAACAAAGVHPRVVSLAPRTLDDVWTSLATVAEALDDAAAGRALVARVRARARGSARPDAPSAAVVEWLDPPILAGLWTPEIVRAAGGRSLGPEPGAPGLRTTWEALAELDPDLLLLSPCSFSVDRTRRELSDPRLRSAVREVTASRGTYLADEAYFSRPGPRLAEGVALLRGLLAGRADGFPLPVARWPDASAEVAA